MQLKFSLIKCKAIPCCIALCIALCIASFIFGRSVGLSKDKSNDVNYHCYVLNAKWGRYASLNEETSILYPQVKFDNPDIDRNMEKKINLTLGKYFAEHLSDVWIYQEKSFYFHLKSKDYLSMHGVYTSSDAKHWDETCCTIDMASGNVLYLSDFIDINEALIKKIKTSGIAKVDVYDDLTQPVDGDVYRQSYLDSISSDEIYNRLAMCSESYSISSNNKPSFYLEKGRLYFVNLFEWSEYDNPIAFYIELDDLDEFLKVEKW